MASPEILFVSRALKEHGIVHFESAPDDEYDCCAETAINSYKEYLLLTKQAQKDSTIVSDLLN